MGVAAFEKRLRALEEMMAVTGDACNCRFEGRTVYHDSAELQRILSVCCPVHGFRDLGDVSWIGRGLPLRREDQRFCCCPPCAVRELLLGKRGTLTPAEEGGEEQRWVREYGASSDEEFRRDQERVKQLLRIYEYNKSIRRRINGQRIL